MTTAQVPRVVSASRDIDWTRLTDEKRLPRARATTADRLQASLARLAGLAERS